MQNIANLTFIIAGAAIFYCGFRVGSLKFGKPESDTINPVYQTKLEPAPVQSEKDKKDEEEVKSYFYQ